MPPHSADTGSVAARTPTAAPAEGKLGAAMAAKARAKPGGGAGSTEAVNDMAGSVQGGGNWAATLGAVAALWLGILAVPLALTHDDSYKRVFPAAWRINHVPEGEWPSPLGLSLGLGTVAVGMLFSVAYHWLHLRGVVGALVPVQSAGPPTYAFMEGVATHFAQPEGFVLLGGYLIGTWMAHLMPDSYYSFEGGVCWWQCAACLLLQDGIQYLMHRVEHSASAELYKVSHKPHHRFTNPRIFDAFNGSATDTFLMILVPLYATACCIHCNVWTYMAFGSLYANWLTLIHSEFVHPWDFVFKRAGFGTAADHHVHHKMFLYNYGHLFMYWDMLAGTYRDPATIRVFSKDRGI